MRGCGRRRSIAALPLVLALILGACNAPAETLYVDMAAAEAGGAVMRGWVPPFLPRGATEIREAHEIETGETWGRFRLDDTERREFARTLVPATVAQVGRVRSPRLGWWPEVLEGELNDERVRQAGYVVFRKKEVFLAFDEQHGYVYFWALPS